MRLLPLLLALAWPAVLWAGAWTLPQGKFWGKATLFMQTTEDWYLVLLC